ncbi:MAG: 16S rRNA (guanine(966)-N(2))-methyltransferase RsmD [Deltaproteobacteria bacterium]|nr:16S rRNA (guanine(966)-N(2))-methyltransferase RsmD [Deltaproteobacteria bacterium]
MRITGGSDSGRILSKIPRSALIRPTSDKVREAIFSILGQDLDGIAVLDLFSGTGSLGLEALSRGAGSAVFIDHSREAIRLIRKNIALCGHGESARVLRKDLRKGLPKALSSTQQPFDLVFLDPPYRFTGIPFVMAYLTKDKRLSPGAWAVAETSTHNRLPPQIGYLRAVDTRSYGDTRITFYVHKPHESAKSTRRHHEFKNGNLPRLF